MEPLKVGLIAAAAAASALGVWLHERSNRRRALALLAGRPQLDSSAFGQRYFGQTDRRAALAAQTRELLAKHVPFKLDGLAPGDAFVADLRMDELDSLSTVEFLVDIEKQLGLKIPDADAQQIFTFGQLVEYLESRLPGYGPAP